MQKTVAKLLKSGITACLLLAAGSAAFQFYIYSQPPLDRGQEIHGVTLPTYQGIPVFLSVEMPFNVPHHVSFPITLKVSPINSGDSLRLVLEGADFVANPDRYIFDEQHNQVTVTCRPRGDVGKKWLVFRTLLPNRFDKSEILTFEVFASISDRIQLTLEIFVIVAAAYFSNRALISWWRQRSAAVEDKVSAAEAKAEKEPEKAKYAWDVAKANLELYFERNRIQVSQVFLISIIVMAIGFGFVLFGVYLALQNKGITATLVAGISGVITQFIGATFMVIYRSTMTQANQFMTVLERINTVGMAVQVLDSIPEDEKQLKNETRAQIVSLLLSANISAKAPIARKGKTAGQGQ